jgi:hypothetical protein
MELPWELLGLDRATRVLHVNVIHGTHKLTEERIDELLEDSGVSNAVVITKPDLEVAYRGLKNVIPFLMQRRAQQVVMSEEERREVVKRFKEAEDGEFAFVERVTSQGDEEGEEEK